MLNIRVHNAEYKTLVFTMLNIRVYNTVDDGR